MSLQPENNRWQSFLYARDSPFADLGHSDRSEESPRFPRSFAALRMTNWLSATEKRKVITTNPHGCVSLIRIGNDREISAGMRVGLPVA